jgi:hypothetical protein
VLGVALYLCTEFPSLRPDGECIHHWCFCPMVIAQRYIVVGADHVPEVSLGQGSGGKAASLLETSEVLQLLLLG